MFSLFSTNHIPFRMQLSAWLPVNSAIVISGGISLFRLFNIKNAVGKQNSLYNKIPTNPHSRIQKLFLYSVYCYILYLLGIIEILLSIQKKVKVKSLSHVQLFATPWTVAYQASTRRLHPWDFPGKNTGVGYHFLLQGIFLTQGLNPGLPHWRQML